MTLIANREIKNFKIIVALIFRSYEIIKFIKIY